MKRPLLVVTWKDHHADGGWADVDTFHSPAKCYAVGWLFKEDDEAITLAGGYSSDARKGYTTGNLMYILKSCITARKDLDSPITDEE
jgi:hypothetical protein